MSYISPFAPSSLPSLPAIAGVKLATIATEMRYKNRDDVLLVELAEGTTVASVFTTSLTAGACIEWGKKALREGDGKARVLIVNAGIANVCNGAAGMHSVEAVVSAASKKWNAPAYQIFHSATGIIGQKIKEELIINALPQLQNTLTEKNWSEAAGAINTTDTFSKLATRSATIDGVKVTLNGFIKGSGMIAPNMATMLGYMFTDAAISHEALQRMLVEAVEPSFNSITVDSDMSTSDTVMLFATQKSSHALINNADDPRASDFKRALLELCTELATLVVKDGEGISKFITINVSGALSDTSARVIGLSIANSPLVKTAIAGEDANWGRIAMAVGKAGEAINAAALSIAMGGVTIFDRGELNPAYDESIVTTHIKGREILIDVNVGNIGSGKSTVWTCDLTHEYIAINADYRS